ncbi:MAG: acetyl/propionyl/methylcrotonyl-CoA carboxylase subunit alpha [Thermomicrobiales bacterium]
MGSLQRVLIANRGEIAVRVIRACRELGVYPVAVYGGGEERSRHVRLADEAHRIPDGDRLPYLNIDAIVAIALRANAQAIHPGYGFLSENADFALACGRSGLIFVGPTPGAIEAMGDKVRARAIALQAGVPIVPGADASVPSREAAYEWAEQIGFPVAIKAAGGGGGRGFRIAPRPEDLAAAFDGAAGEASRYFGNPTVYLERYLPRPRHVEVQIFADGHGDIVALGERDCSVQRRHQKLIEETPSPAVDHHLRTSLFNAAIALARAVEYSGAGTVEFLVAEDGSFYFLEMNTRIQVEHTITEETTGIDLVREQLLVAAGNALSFRQTEIEARGHAIQCRINAEDAGRGFAPTPGVLTAYQEPGGFGVRVDSAMEPGAEIMPAYDSLIAKLVAWGRDRDEAIARMRRALGEFRIEGVPSTIPFHQRVFMNEAFVRRGATTAFLDEHPDVLPEPAAVPDDAARETPSAWREVLVEVNGRQLSVRVNGDPLSQPNRAQRTAPKRPVHASRGSTAVANEEKLRSPIQGTVLRVAAKTGTRVEAGDLICVIEAMKMENEIRAHRLGEVVELPIVQGGTVKIGDLLAVIR